MNCTTAREWLMIAPSSLGIVVGDEPLSSEEREIAENIAAAHAHAATCVSCAEFIQGWQHWDHKLTAAMNAVPIPIIPMQGIPGGTGCPSAGYLCAPAQEVVSSKVSSSNWRPRWPQATLAVAIALMLAVLVYDFWPRSSATSDAPAMLAAAATPVLNDSPFVPGPLPAELGFEWSRLAGFLWGQPFEVTTGSGAIRRATPFRFHDGRGNLRQGLLFILHGQSPSAAFSRDFGSAEVHYTPSSAWTAWNDGKNEFVCVVSGDALGLESLRSRLAAPAGLS